MFDSTIQLRSFFERITTISFFQRLFFWKKVRTELIDAVSALSSFQKELEDIRNTSARDWIRTSTPRGAAT